MQSRRSALIRIATATASAALGPLIAKADGVEHHVHEMADTAPVMTPQVPSYFSKSDYETVTKLADLIIPRTDTPGAADAGVPYRIDQAVGAKPELQEQFKAGLAYLSEQAHAVNGADFATLTEVQQKTILETLSADPKTAGGFFQTVKDLTIDHYYSSEQGLVQELGFKGNTFRASFPGCTHPEHWPTGEHA